MMSYLDEMAALRGGDKWDMPTKPYGASGFCVGYLSEIPAGNKNNPPLWKIITVRNLA